jgi:hypothetical protein
MVAEGSVEFVGTSVTLFDYSIRFALEPIPKPRLLLFALN